MSGATRHCGPPAPANPSCFVSFGIGAFGWLRLLGLAIWVSTFNWLPRHCLEVVSVRYAIAQQRAGAGAPCYSGPRSERVCLGPRLLWKMAVRPKGVRHPLMLVRRRPPG